MTAWSQRGAGCVALLAVSSAIAAGGHAGRTPTDPPRLQTITAAEMRANGIRGTGCSWSLRGESEVRLAVAGDRGLAKVDGRLIPLRPWGGARDLFPFTFDRWVNGALSIRIRERGPGRMAGGETVASIADLEVVAPDGRRTVRGALECGS